MDIDEIDIREELARLEHEQWQYWSKKITSEIMDNTLSYGEMGRRFLKKHQNWLPYWKSYDELDEETKELDRKWADKVLGLLLKKIDKAINPYPSDIFIETPQMDKQKINKFCRDNGISIDGYNGSWGRKVWNNCKQKIKDLLEVR